MQISTQVAPFRCVRCAHAGVCQCRTDPPPLPGARAHAQRPSGGLFRWSRRDAGSAPGGGRHDRVPAAAQREHRLGVSDQPGNRPGTVRGARGVGGLGRWFCGRDRVRSQHDHAHAASRPCARARVALGGCGGRDRARPPRELRHLACAGKRARPGGTHRQDATRGWPPRPGRRCAEAHSRHAPVGGRGGLQRARHHQRCRAAGPAGACGGCAGVRGRGALLQPPHGGCAGLEL